MTTRTPILAVFDLARPLQLGTAAVLQDKSNAETGIGVAVLSAWESCCYDTKTGQEHGIQPEQLWLPCQDQMDLLGWSIVASAIGSCCYGQGAGRTGPVWVSCLQPGTAAATVQSSRPDWILYIKQKTIKNLKTLKNPHSTHALTHENRFGQLPEELGVPTGLLLMRLSFSSTFLSSHLFLITVQNQKHQKKLKT